MQIAMQQEMTRSIQTVIIAAEMTALWNAPLVSNGHADTKLSSPDVNCGAIYRDGYFNIRQLASQPLRQNKDFRCIYIFKRPLI